MANRLERVFLFGVRPCKAVASVMYNCHILICNKFLLMVSGPSLGERGERQVKAFFSAQYNCMLHSISFDNNYIAIVVD